MVRLRTATGAVIVTAWAIALTKGLVTRDYEGLDLTTPVMLIFAGYVFGESLIRRRLNGEHAD